MKKVLSIVCMILTGIFIFSCGVAADELCGKWFVITTRLDEFGDEIECSEPTIGTLIEGSFSNSVTTDSELSGSVLIDSNDGCFNVIFTLLENGEIRATYNTSDADHIKLKTKIGDDVSEFQLRGFAPNGVLFLGLDNSHEAEWFLENLLLGNDIKCIICIGDSKYSFTIENEGITSACTKANYNRYTFVNDYTLMASVYNLATYIAENETQTGPDYFEHEFLNDDNQRISMAASSYNDTGTPYVVLVDEFYDDQHEVTMQTVILLHEADTMAQMVIGNIDESINGSIKKEFSPIFYKDNLTIDSFYQNSGTESVEKPVPQEFVNYWNTTLDELFEMLNSYLSDNECGLTLTDFGFLDTPQMSEN